MHKTADPKKKKTFCKRKENKEAYFSQRVTAQFKLKSLI